MDPGAERRFTRPRQQLGEAGITKKVAAHRQRVDEETDQPLDLGAPAVGDR
jgi:hypothetical protein